MNDYRGGGENGDEEGKPPNRCGSASMLGRHDSRRRRLPDKLFDKSASSAAASRDNDGQAHRQQQQQHEIQPTTILLG